MNTNLISEWSVLSGLCREVWEIGNELKPSNIIAMPYERPMAIPRNMRTQCNQEERDVILEQERRSWTVELAEGQKETQPRRPVGVLRRRLLHRNGNFVPLAPLIRARWRVKTGNWRRLKWSLFMLSHALGCDMAHETLSRLDPHPGTSPP